MENARILLGQAEPVSTLLIGAITEKLQEVLLHGKVEVIQGTVIQVMYGDIAVRVAEAISRGTTRRHVRFTHTATIAQNMVIKPDLRAMKPNIPTGAAGAAGAFPVRAVPLQKMLKPGLYTVIEKSFPHIINV